MMNTTKGRFKITSQTIHPDEVTESLGAMRMAFYKTFEGGLKAKSVVSMMGILNQDIGSGAYVALEKITGELENKKGSFGLQHSSAMLKGVQSQLILVIPDSGTDELTGISGKMTIEILGDQHSYHFEYEMK